MPLAGGVGPRVARRAVARGGVVLIAALTAAAFGLLFARVPWPHTDLVRNLEQAADLGWSRTIQTAFASDVEYRPLLLIGIKLAYTAGGLHLWFYKALVLAQLAALLALLLAILRPSGSRRVLAAGIAVLCVLGLHTSRILFLFLPVNGYSLAMLPILAAIWLIADPRGRAREWVFVPLTVGALLWLEMGVLIVPLVLVGWWLSAPGVTWRGVLGACAGLLLYAVTRRWFGASIAGLASPESGLGFEDVSPQDLARIFTHAPWLFWLYNVGSSLLTVLASEPRDGKFKFVAALLHGTAAPWQWLHVVSSLATSAVVAGVLLLARTLSPRDRLLAGLGTVLLLGGSALGFLYTRDRIGLPAGFGYAMLLYVAAAAGLERASTSRARSLAAVTLVAVVGVCWLWRTAEAGVALRDRAWEYYLEWTVRYHPETETPLAHDLHQRVIAHRPADPRRDPAWSYRWFERQFDRAGGS